jgi:hypothetical protein
MGSVHAKLGLNTVLVRVHGVPVRSWALDSFLPLGSQKVEIRQAVLGRRRPRDVHWRRRKPEYFVRFWVPIELFRFTSQVTAGENKRRQLEDITLEHKCWATHRLRMTTSRCEHCRRTQPTHQQRWR